MADDARQLTALRDENAALHRDLTRARHERDALSQAQSQTQADLRGHLDRTAAALSERQTQVEQHIDRTDAALARLARLLTAPLGVIPLRRRVGGWLRAALTGRLRRRLTQDHAIAVIARSGCFDAAFYLNRYPDVALSGVDPIVHYVRYGAGEGRNPHPGFDTGFYCSTYPDVTKRGANPLTHYILHGRAEGRRPNPAAAPDFHLLTATLFGVKP